MKYIIELDDIPFVRKDCPDIGVDLYRAKGFRSLVFDAEGLKKLKPYKDPDEAYQMGLDDAWEAAKMITGGYLTLDERYKIFNSRMECKIFSLYTAKECVEKINEYMESRENEEKFQIGDVIVSTVDVQAGENRIKTSAKAVVTDVYNNDQIDFIYETGEKGGCLNDAHKYWRKTGRNVFKESEGK